MLKKNYPYLDEVFLKKNHIYSNALARFSFPYYALSRGLSVSWINMRNVDSYSSYYKYEGIGGFYTIRGLGKEYSFNFSRVLNKGQDTSLVRKDRLDKLLNTLRIKYPKHITVKKSEGMEVFKQLSYPMVIKPIFGSMGQGVYANIQNDAELQFALSNQTSGIMAEEYIEGDEYRIYILNGEPIAYCKRHAPSVKGNGDLTIKELIIKENQKKLKKGLAKIIIDDDLIQVLECQGKNIDYIPISEEVVVLSHKKGRSSGANIETITSINYKIHEQLKSIGKYLDTFSLIGVDCIVSKNELYVLEVNLRPQISSALLPDLGPAINIPKLVIDGLFGVYRGNLLTPENFSKKLKEVDKLRTLTWNDMSYDYQNGFSLSI